MLWAYKSYPPHDWFTSPARDLLSAHISYMWIWCGTKRSFKAGWKTHSIANSAKQSATTSKGHNAWLHPCLKVQGASPASKKQQRLLVPSHSRRTLYLLWLCTAAGIWLHALSMMILNFHNLNILILIYALFIFVLYTLQCPHCVLLQRREKS